MKQEIAQKTDNLIDFIKPKNIMMALSVILIVAEIIITFSSGGFNLGIDFKPGISLEVDLKATSSVDDLKTTLSKDFPETTILAIGTENKVFNIKVSDKSNTPDFQNITSKKIVEDLKVKFPSVAKNSEYYIGASLSKSSTSQISIISAVVLVLILIYVSFRFHWTYALGAIIALFHDGIISLFFIGATKLELSIPIIVAIITIIGYSLNDTIVIFDRIRENIKLEIDASLSKIINISINATLKRSLLTSFTTLITMIALVFLTKGDVRNFSITMIVGITVGTYSSIFIASPIFLMLKGDKYTAPKPKPKKETSPSDKPQMNLNLKEESIDFEKERKKLEQELKNKKK